jgi:hypothetical protein
VQGKFHWKPMGFPWIIIINHYWPVLKMHLTIINHY